MITAYAFKLRDGRVVVGAVQGSGGLVAGPNGALRIRNAIRHANEGKPLHICEPKPGHVLLYPAATAADAGPSEVVDLRGARLLETL